MNTNSMITNTSDTFNRTYTTNESNCANIQVNAIFIIVSLLLLIFGVTGAVLHMMVLSLLPRFKIFSANVQLMLHNLAIASILACCVIVVRSVYNGCIVILGFDNIKIDNMVCALLDGTYVASRCTLMLSIATIGAERLYVTLSGNLINDNYASKSVIVLAISTWFVGVISVGLLIWNAASSCSHLCYCYFSFTLTIPVLAGAAGSYAFLELNVIIVYWYVYYKSRKKLMNFTINTAQHNLQERFQMWNNVRTTSMLFPWIICHGLFYAVTLICNIFVASFYHANASISSVNGLLVILTIWTVDLVLAPILWIRNNERFKSIAVWRFPFLRFLVGVAKNSPSDIAVGCAITERKRILTTTRSNYTIEHRIEPEKSSEILEKIWASKNFNDSKRNTPQTRFGRLVRQK